MGEITIKCTAICVRYLRVLHDVLHLVQYVSFAMLKEAGLLNGLRRASMDSTHNTQEAPGKG